MTDTTKSIVEDEDPGSRDHLRNLLKQAEAKLMECALELEKLKASDKKKIDYRYADPHLGIAICEINIVRVLLRKRKLKSSTPQVEAKPLIVGSEGGII